MLNSIQEIIDTLTLLEKEKFHNLIEELLANEIDIRNTKENSLLLSSKFHEFISNILNNLQKAKDLTEEAKVRLSDIDFYQIPKEKFYKV